MPGFDMTHLVCLKTAGEASKLPLAQAEAPITAREQEEGLSQVAPKTPRPVG